MLFRQDNLPDGEHTLVVTNSGNASLAIISALPVIWSKDPGHAHGIHGGIIAAIVVGLSIGIAMLVFLWLWFTRRKYTYQGVHMEDYAGTPVAYMPAYESTPFVFPIASPGRQAGAHSPRKCANEQYQGTGHSAQYHSSNTSPSSGSGGHWGYSPVASPASPNFNREASGFRPYSHDALPVVYGHIRPSGQGRKPTVPVSLSQIRPAGAPNLLRDSGANSTLLPPSYKAAIISHSRDRGLYNFVQLNIISFFVRRFH
ncbi:hypothetical protein RSOLAG1IB_09437 [Rhizoctonia solani AG-1 IB]|uniref:Uncharacterized protein n=1 Tax=Thanatephorus cucumeris (strain AG1-IB / isolate 7/3/14) TaxID=1108050 RepID=A0A0B7FTK3_THACB|nr:hypothetical protein RSOLAG1IB_09437 [Rhizoctonia solani AG-1 IB]